MKYGIWLVGLVFLFCLVQTAFAQSEGDGLGLFSASLEEREGWWSSSLPDGQNIWIGPLLLRFQEGDVEFADAEVDPYGGLLIQLVLSEEAGGKFVELTEEQIGNYVALVVGERVLTAPNIQERIPDGRVVIIGLTVEEAQTFASEIRSATGAVRRVDHLRNVQDLSSPYGAAVALVTALQKEEWATVADVLHPDALGELRVNYEGNFVISGDSARTTTDSGNVAAVLIADVLGRRPIASRMEDLTDHDAVGLGARDAK